MTAQLQADNEKFGNHCVYRLHDLVGLAAERAAELLHGTMNQTAEKLPQLFGKAQRCQLLTDVAANHSDIAAPSLHLFMDQNQIANRAQVNRGAVRGHAANRLSMSVPVSDSTFSTNWGRLKDDFVLWFMQASLECRSLIPASLAKLYFTTGEAFLFIYIKHLAYINRRF